MLYNFIIKNVMLHIVLFIIVIALILFELYEFIYSKNAINTEKAIELINRKNAIIIDTRSENNFRICHIVSSINIPHDKIKKHVNVIKQYKKKTIIIIHYKNRLAQKLINDIKSNNFNDIFYIKDGLNAWNKHDLPTKKR